MDNFSNIIKRFFGRKMLLRVFALSMTFCLLIFFPSCKKKIERFSYVSEIRSNILLAETDGFSLRIFIGEKESPYSADGVPRERSPRFDAYLVAPDGTKTCDFHFKINGEKHGGEMSFDNVKGEYYYLCTLPVNELNKLDCEITYGDTTFTMEAKSVLTAQTLSPQEILQSLEACEKEFFAKLTDKYGFAGEIYIRLIFEEKAYYYIGVIERDGKTSAFLLNAETGKLLAKRQSQT